MTFVTGAFVFGLLMTMIFVDVTKMMTGRLRPTFIHTCRPDFSQCDADGRSEATVVCQQTDAHLIRAARYYVSVLLSSVCRTITRVFFTAEQPQERDYISL